MVTIYNYSHLLALRAEEAAAEPRQSEQGLTAHTDLCRRALAQLPPALARWQRTSSVLALPCLPGLGALCQLGSCQGSNSSPPNSRAGAVSSSARPILTLSLLPLSHSMESPLFCHRASRRVEWGVANPSGTPEQVSISQGHSPNGGIARGPSELQTLRALPAPLGRCVPASLCSR